MLQIVATPIGNLADITLRALEALKTCDAIIGEEHRVASTLLKKLNLEQKDIYELNEHSKPKDVIELVNLCRSKNIVLISDCGTPVFSDPGAELIAACRKEKILMSSLPGASSLMTLISLSSQPLKQFLFIGFMPANKTERAQALQTLKNEKKSWIIMDTPYRLKAVLHDLAEVMPNEKALLGMNLTQSNETILEGTLKEIKNKCPLEEAEFILLKYERK